MMKSSIMPIFIKVGDIMNRIKNQLITYDSNLIIYYCFSTKNHEIIELTSKTKKLTEYLINNNSEIILPQFIIDIKLIAFSKEKNTTLISNDYDITYFSKELIEKNLAHQIFNLKELIIYN